MPVSNPICVLHVPLLVCMLVQCSYVYANVIPPTAAGLTQQTVPNLSVFIWKESNETRKGR